MKFAENIYDLIGKTPLLKIKTNIEGEELNCTLLAKLEYQNPGGSVKDRIALSIIEKAEKQNLINLQTTIIEATSGNTGIGLAMVCAAKGYKLILTMPESMSLERRKLLKAYGAEIILTPAEQGMTGAVKRAEELASEIKNSFIASQFENPANPSIHKETTAKEIWEDTNGKIDILVVGVGTGGTISGIASYIKELKPSFKSIAVEPEESAVLSGGKVNPHKIQGIGAGFIPKNLDLNLVDEIIKVSSKDAVYTSRALAKKGLLFGISSGACLKAAFEIAKRPEALNKVIVAIIPSCGERYLSTVLYDEDY